MHRPAVRRRQHPPWIGVFFVLLLHRKRHLALDAGQPGDLVAQAQLLLGLGDLLLEEPAQQPRPAPFEQQLRSRHGRERKVGGYHREHERRNRLARGERGDQRILQPTRVPHLLGAGGEHVLIDEALPPKPATEREHALVGNGGGRTHRHVENDPAEGCEIALEREVAHRGGFEHATQQRIAGNRCKPAQPEDVLSRKLRRPRPRDALDPCPNAEVDVQEGRNDSWILIEQLGHQHERACKLLGCLVQLALLQQRAGERVVALGVIRLGRRAAFLLALRRPPLLSVHACERARWLNRTCCTFGSLMST